MNATTAGLQRAGILAQTGYGRGLPVLLPWGLAVVDRIIDLVEGALRQVVPRGWVTWTPDLVRDAVSYRNESSHTSGADTTFQFGLNGRDRVLRPDAAVDGLRRAAALDGACDARGAFAAYQAHRDLKGACTPLNRDRAIWPVMQFDALAPLEQADRLLDDLLAALDAVFAALGLPTVKVDHGPWKRYARRRIDWVVASGAVAPTVVAMAYEVGDRFRELAGVDDDVVAWDVGLTARPLRLLWDLGAKGGRCPLPPAIAPVQAVIGSSAAADEPPVPSGVRVEVVDDGRKGWWRPWYAGGVPLIVARSAHRRRCLVGNRSWADTSEPIDELLRGQSVAAPRVVHQLPVDGQPGFAFLCDAHANRLPMAAPARPAEHGACHRCGERGVRRLVAATDQVY